MELLDYPHSSLHSLRHADSGNIWSKNARSPSLYRSLHSSRALPFRQMWRSPPLSATYCSSWARATAAPSRVWAEEGRERGREPSLCQARMVDATRGESEDAGGGGRRGKSPHGAAGDGSRDRRRMRPRIRAEKKGRRRLRWIQEAAPRGGVEGADPAVRRGDGIHRPSVEEKELRFGRLAPVPAPIHGRRRQNLGRPGEAGGSGGGVDEAAKAVALESSRRALAMRSRLLVFCPSASLWENEERMV